jgi:hypothetical protein
MTPHTQNTPQKREHRAKTNKPKNPKAKQDSKGVQTPENRKNIGHLRDSLRQIKIRRMIFTNKNLQSLLSVL